MKTKKFLVFLIIAALLFGTSVTAFAEQTDEETPNSTSSSVSPVQQGESEPTEEEETTEDSSATNSGGDSSSAATGTSTPEKDNSQAGSSQPAAQNDSARRSPATRAATPPVAPPSHYSDIIAAVNAYEADPAANPLPKWTADPGLWVPAGWKVVQKTDENGTYYILENYEIPGNPKKAISEFFPDPAFAAAVAEKLTAYYPAHTFTVDSKIYANDKEVPAQVDYDQTTRTPNLYGYSRNLPTAGNSLVFNDLGIRNIEGVQYFSGAGTLHLSGNNITDIPTGVFDGTSFTKLRNLYFKDNPITTIKANTFVNFSNLSVLALTQCSELTTIEVGAFKNCNFSTSLNIVDTLVTSIPAGAFENVRVGTFNLHNNKLTALTKETLQGITEMKLLQVFDNEIATLDADLFEGLGGKKNLLHTVSLSRNNIASLPLTLCSGLTGLHTFQVNGNQLSEFPTGFFNNIGNGQFSSIDFSDNNFMEFPAELVPKLKDNPPNGNNYTRIKCAGNHIIDLSMLVGKVPDKTSNTNYTMFDARNQTRTLSGQADATATTSSVRYLTLPQDQLVLTGVDGVKNSVVSGGTGSNKYDPANSRFGTTRTNNTVTVTGICPSYLAGNTVRLFTVTYTLDITGPWYDVNFLRNDDTTAVHQKVEDVEWNTAAGSPASAPQRLGYKFGAWYTKQYPPSASEPGGAAFLYKWTNSTKVYSNTDVHAWWQTYAYNVTFNPNGGTLPSNNQVTVASPHYTVGGTTEGMPANPQKPGERFVGWYISGGNGQNTPFDENTLVEGDITVHAQWEPNTTPSTHTVTFNSQQGSTVPSLSGVAHGSTIAAPANPTRIGYTFAGWYREAAAINEWNFSQDTVTDNITLYAKWVRNPVTTTYTVSFNSRGGSAVASIGGIAPGSTISAPANPTRTGYTFGGWFKEVGTTNAWNFGRDTVTSNITLYARWLRNPAPPAATHTVTFNSQGGSAVAPVSGIAAGSTIAAPANPTRTGYTFTGWYQESSAVNQWNFSSQAVNSDITLYAGWRANVTPPLVVRPVVDVPEEPTPPASTPATSGQTPPTSSSNPTVSGNNTTPPPQAQQPERGTVDENDVPLFGFGRTDVWSLLNLFLMFAGIAFAALHILRLALGRRRGSNAPKGLALILSVAGIAVLLVDILVFLFTQHLSGTMVIIDAWTPLMFILFALGLVITFRAASRWKRDQRQTEEEYEEV